MVNQDSQLYYPTDIALKMTDYCPNNCYDKRYCFAENSSDGRQWIDKSRIKDIFQQAKACGLINLLYFSCEPFADYQLLLFITRTARDAVLKPRFLDTSGYYVGESLKKSEGRFRRLRDNGFDISVEPNYIGTNYNGIDVSVDQFHPISPEQCASTILGALHVFGPTEYVNIRVTHPSPKFNDDSNKNRVINLLIESGEVKDSNTRTHELIFRDGSRVCLNHLVMHDDGFAARLARKNQEMFYRRQFNLAGLSEYKDLREMIRFRKMEIPLPFHKLYIDPDGQTHPSLSRLSCLSGGNIYEIGVDEAIRNIQANPLVSLLIGCGLSGILQLIEKHTSKKIPLYGTGSSTIGLEMLKNEKLMNKIKLMIEQMGLDDKLRTELLPAINGLRTRMESAHRIKAGQR